jgi:hypothetical protein
MSEHTDKFRTLARRLKEDTAKIGMNLENFILVPSLEDGMPDIVQAVFSVAEEADSKQPAHESVGDDPEQADFDAKFENLIGDFTKQTERDKVADLKAEMEKNLREGKGLFD